MLLTEHTKLAWASIRGAKTRSLLTMFGIIVGISSVVTVVSLGDGLKQQISAQVHALGSELRVVQSSTRRSSVGDLIPRNALPAANITSKDIEIITKNQGVEKIVPIGVVSADVRQNGRSYDKATVYASNQNLTELLNQKVQFGGFFSGSELNRNFAVIGRTVADQLFKERSPVGKVMQVGGQEVLVIGVFEAKNFQPVPYSIDFNNAVVVPSDFAAQLSGGATYYEVLAQYKKDADAKTVTNELEQALKAANGNSNKLAVLEPDEIVGSTGVVFNQVTLFVAGVALISLIVGGIGIMNIMFATVSERTREIGIRKAIGATNRQILNQFITEAILLSVIGSFIGVILSLAINGFLRVTTSLQPVVTVRTIAISVGVAVVTGVVSGILPAAKAARKRPIDALRYDR